MYTLRDSSHNISSLGSVLCGPVWKTWRVFVFSWRPGDGLAWVLLISYDPAEITKTGKRSSWLHVLVLENVEFDEKQFLDLTSFYFTPTESTNVGAQNIGIN